VTTPVVEIENLSRRFGTFTAVDRLTLVANAGEVFGLLGSNGAGKTTTIKLLTTLLPPSSGEARVGGFSITTQPVEVRRAIGYVPQAVSVDGSLTGYENLLIFAKLYDIPRSEQQPQRRSPALSVRRRHLPLRMSLKSPRRQKNITFAFLLPFSKRQQKTGMSCFAPCGPF
jgi:ABC-2 type transport system ATP-binding protein